MWTETTQASFFTNARRDERVYPASTTKIMTCLVALEYGNLDDEFMVGEEVLGTTIKFTSYSSLWASRSEKR